MSFDPLQAAMQEADRQASEAQARNQAGTMYRLPSTGYTTQQANPGMTTPPDAAPTPDAAPLPSPEPVVRRRAKDGQSFDQQDPMTQSSFRYAYGDGAENEWIRQHEAELDRSANPTTTPPPVAPSPVPAVTPAAPPAARPGGNAYGPVGFGSQSVGWSPFNVPVGPQPAPSATLGVAPTTPPVGGSVTTAAPSVGASAGGGSGSTPAAAPTPKPAVENVLGLGAINGVPAPQPPVARTVVPTPGTTTPIKNPDGSSTTERSITVTEPGLNGGRPTNIPTVWGGQVVSDGQAVSFAIASQLQWPSFASIPEAVSAAQARSKSLGDGATSIGGASLSPVQTPSYSPNDTISVYDTMTGQTITARGGDFDAQMQLYPGLRTRYVPREVKPTATPPPPTAGETGRPPLAPGPVLGDPAVSSVTPSPTTPAPKPLPGEPGGPPLKDPAGNILDPSGNIVQPLAPVERTSSNVSFNPQVVADRYAGGVYTFGGGRDAQGYGIPGTKNTDCSGFVSAVMKERGVNLPAHTDSAYNALRSIGAKQIPASEAQPGDIVFYMGSGFGGTVTYHMGLYAGPGQILDSSQWRGDTGVKLRPLTHAGGMSDIVILRDPRVNGQPDPRVSMMPPDIQPSGIAETAMGDQLTTARDTTAPPAPSGGSRERATQTVWQQMNQTA